MGGRARLPEGYRRGGLGCVTTRPLNDDDRQRRLQRFFSSICGIYLRLFYKTLKKFQILACIDAMVPVYYPLRRGLSAVGSAPPCQGGGRGFEPRSPLHAFPGRCESAFFIWRSGQVVRHGPAKPLPPVRIRASPPEKIGTRSGGVPFIAWASRRRSANIGAICNTGGSSGDKLSPEGRF